MKITWWIQPFNFDSALQHAGTRTQYAPTTGTLIAYRALRAYRHVHRTHSKAHEHIYLHPVLSALAALANRHNPTKTDITRYQNILRGQAPPPQGRVSTSTPTKHPCWSNCPTKTTSLSPTQHVTLQTSTTAYNPATRTISRTISHRMTPPISQPQMQETRNHQTQLNLTRKTSPSKTTV